jgi:hypothetical protein
MTDDKTKARGDTIAAMYRSKLREIQNIKNAGEGQIADARAAATNSEFTVRTMTADLQDEVMRVARQAVTDLALVHVRHSRASVSAMVEMICTELVDVALQGVPPTGFFRERHGFAGFSATGQQYAAEAETRLFQLRNGLRQDVADVVTQTLAANPRKNFRERADEWWKRSLLGGIVAAIVGLSTIGSTAITWFRTIRDWGTVKSASASSPVSTPTAVAPPLLDAGAKEGH